VANKNSPGYFEKQYEARKMIEPKTVRMIADVFFTLGRDGFLRVYSEALQQEVYLVLEEGDKKLVCETDCPVYTASEYREMTDKWDGKYESRIRTH
jgi:hypothetical protein